MTRFWTGLDVLICSDWSTMPVILPIATLPRILSTWLRTCSVDGRGRRVTGGRVGASGVAAAGRMGTAGGAAVGAGIKIGTVCGGKVSTGGGGRVVGTAMSCCCWEIMDCCRVSGTKVCCCWSCCCCCCCCGCGKKYKNSLGHDIY